MIIARYCWVSLSNFTIILITLSSDPNAHIVSGLDRSLKLDIGSDLELCMFDILCQLTLRRFNYFEGRGLLECKKI